MADNIVFTNNASALLAASIGTGDTSVQVAAGYGANFPNPTGGDYFQATLEDNSGNIEIVKCTGRATDILTVVRAQEGTTPKAFTLTVTRVELRLTKATIEEFLQKNGGTITGTIDFNQNTLTDPYISGPNARMTQGQIVGVPLRGDIDTSSNELAVPSGGGRATVGAAEILAKGDDVVAELDTAGVIILNSASVGVRIPAGAYLRVEGATPANHMSVAHDDTDCNFTFPNTDEVNWDTLLNITGGGLRVQDLDLTGPQFVDFSLKQQTIAAASTLNVDYEAGSYVIVTMGTSFSSLVLQNPPASEVGVIRFKFVQDGTGGHTGDFSGIEFAGGSAFVLSTAPNAVDFLDVWTDDNGTTWYGGYDNAWA